MRQVLALDLPRTLAGNLAPIGCEYQAIRAAPVAESTIPSRCTDESLGPECSAIMDRASWKMGLGPTLCYTNFTTKCESASEHETRRTETRI